MLYFRISTLWDPADRYCTADTTMWCRSFANSNVVLLQQKLHVGTRKRIIACQAWLWRGFAGGNSERKTAINDAVGLHHSTNATHCTKVDVGSLTSSIVFEQPPIKYNLRPIKYIRQAIVAKLQLKVIQYYIVKYI